eukprot:COSAG06_NODE_23964_length_676_cov_1.107452_1_plen_50_part_10
MTKNKEKEQRVICAPGLFSASGANRLTQQQPGEDANAALAALLHSSHQMP